MLSAAREPTVRLTVAQAIIRYLVRQYSLHDGRRQRLITGVYGIFGHGNVAGLGQAIAECQPGELMFLEGRNEQSMVHAAAAYARASRRRSALACTASCGPGAMNMLVGAAGAHVNRLPVLILPGDEYSQRRQGTILQGLEHPRAGDMTMNDCFRPIARYFDRVSRPELLLTALPAAMRVLTSPEDTGPVVLCLPQDIQTDAWDFPERLFAERTWNIDRPVPDPVSLDEAARLLKSAQRPLIVAGGGVYYSEAEESLRKFADNLGIPVAETYSGKGILAEHSWRNLGGIGVEGTTPANIIARKADVVICVGTRLSDFPSGSQSVFHHPQVRFIGLNISRADAVKNGALPVVGDARASLDGLGARLPGRLTSDAYKAEAEKLVAEYSTFLDAYVSPTATGRMSQLELVRMLNEEAPEGTSVVAAAGTLPGEVLKMWDTSSGTICHLEFGFSCMGYEIPGGIGVRLARPDFPVFVLVGDGTFLMNPTEIVSAVQHGLKVTFIVSANDGMQCIRRLEDALNHRSFANLFLRRDVHTRALSTIGLDLDFAAVARGLGAKATVVNNLDEARAAVRTSLQDPEPWVIVVPTDPTRFIDRHEVWRDMAPAEISDYAKVTEARRHYDASRAEQQRWYI